jgi:hypothetical protein
MRSTLLLAGLAALLVLPACGDDSSPSGTPSVPDSGSPLPDAQNTADSGAATDEAGDDEAAATPAPQVSLRIAHVSPDAPPFDVCLAPTGTTAFQGPFLDAFAAATAAANGTPFPDDSGAATGLSYGQVSAYFLVEPGTYDVRLVAAGATSCDAPLGGPPSGTVDAGASEAGAPMDDGSLDDGSLDDGSLDDGGAVADATVTDLDAGPAPDAATGDGAAAVTTIPSVVVTGSFTTLLVAGEVTPSGSDPALVVMPLADDSILVSGGATLRAVNALASGVAQDFGFESADGGGFLSAFTNVGFAQAATHASPDDGTLDSNGYLAVGPQNGVSFGARASSGATSDTAATQSLQIGLGAVATIAAIGGDSAGKEPPQLLFCVDNQPSGGALSDCAVLPDLR